MPKDSDLVENPAYPGQTVQEKRIDDYVDAALAYEESTDDNDGDLLDASHAAKALLTPAELAIAESNLKRRQAEIDALAVALDPESPVFIGDDAQHALKEDAHQQALDIEAGYDETGVSRGNA